MRANAIVRLCAAREELWRAEREHAAVSGGTAEAGARSRMAEAADEVATREQWLHWLDHGTSLRPERDGEWAAGGDAVPARRDDAPARPRRLRAAT